MKNMKKRVLITSLDLEVGGIETALINMLNNLDLEKYDITLILQNNKGTLINRLNKKINVIDFKYKYRLDNIIFRAYYKIRNTLRLKYFVYKYKNKFDVSACYATYDRNCAYLARKICNNSILWAHTDYLLVNTDKELTKNFFKDKGVFEYKKIVAVSNVCKISIVTLFKELENRIVICRNFIDVDTLKKLSEEKIEEKKPKLPLFINLTRQEEVSKKLTKLLYATKRLKEEGFEFRVWMLGEGPDTNLYKEIIEKEELQDYVKMLGRKENPYPYLKLSDAHILTSDYEGFPMANIEAKLFKIPVITTSVSDSETDIGDKYGIIIKTKDIDGVYTAMKEFITKGYKIKEEFDVNEFNKNILETLENLFDN